MVTTQRGTAGNKETEDQQWAFTVTLMNSRQDAADLEVRYRIYVKRDTLNSKPGGAPFINDEITEGVERVPLARRLVATTFETKPVHVRQSQLVANGSTTYFYKNNHSPRMVDMLDGLWVRVYQSGQLVGEYATPEGLRTRLTWP